MPTSALFSIKPNFAEAILAGEKTYELRRRLFQRSDVDRIVIYASSPVGKVVGEFAVDGVLALEPKQLWSATSKGAAVEKEFFDRYFEGREIGFAIKVGDRHRYSRPRTLKEYCGLTHPPQSFCYLNSTEE